MQLSQPPPVSDTRVNDWLYRLWKAVNENTQDIAVLEAGGGGGGGTVNNYVTQSLTAQDGLDGLDGWPGPMGTAGVAGAAGRAGPPGMDGMDGNGGDGGYASTPAPDTWILAFAAAHG